MRRGNWWNDNKNKRVKCFFLLRTYMYHKKTNVSQISKLSSYFISESIEDGMVLCHRSGLQNSSVQSVTYFLLFRTTELRLKIIASTIWPLGLLNYFSVIISAYLAHALWMRLSLLLTILRAIPDFTDYAAALQL